MEANVSFFRTIFAVMCASAAVASLAFAPAPARANDSAVAAKGPNECNRRCLLKVLTDYTEALTNDDTSNLPVARKLRVTSNGTVTKLGHGSVWGKDRRIKFRQAFVDPKTGAAIFLGTVTNTPTRDMPIWWFYAVRLKIADKKITEVEEISYAGALGSKSAATLQLPDRIFDTVLPEDERSTARRLKGIANEYFDIVSHRMDYRKGPWHPECQRKELGVYTVNSDKFMRGSCEGEFKDPRIKWIVTNRRFYITDVKRGVVIALAHFNAPPDYPDNNPSVVFEIFKVQDGLIRYVEAFFRGNGQLHAGWGTD